MKCPAALGQALLETFGLAFLMRGLLDRAGLGGWEVGGECDWLPFTVFKNLRTGFGLESDVFLYGGRVGGKGLETAFFAFNKPVQFNRSQF